MFQKNKNALVILNGYSLSQEYLDFFWSKYDIHVCADGSYYWVSASGFYPEFVIGDFDSCSQDISVHQTKLLKFSEQNSTDTEKIFQYLLKLSVNNITIIGILGSRMDHLFWNLNLIKQYQKKFKKIDCFSITEKIIISSKKKELFYLPIGTRISFFPFYQNIKGIKSTGLKYELYNQELSLENFASISNEVAKKNIVLEWSCGTLLIFLEQKFLINIEKKNEKNIARN